MSGHWRVRLSSWCLVVMVLPQVSVQADTFQEVLDILLQCQTAYYRLEDYQGVVHTEVTDGKEGFRQETLDIAFRKPGFLSLRWQSGLYKGTTLTVRPGWNHGNPVVRLGDGFEFVTVSLPVTEMSEPFAPGLRDLSEWLTALFLLAQRPVTDRSLRLVEVRRPPLDAAEGRVALSVPSFLLPFRDNGVSQYEFVIERGTGLPVELMLRGAGGEVRQRMRYTDVRVNTGMTTQIFRSEEDRAEGQPTGTETTIDLRGLSRNWQRRYAEITDYSGVWLYETRKGRDDGALSEIEFKFRKPFDLYLQWKTTDNTQQQALYRQGWNRDRVRIRTSWYGIPLIGDVAPDSALAQWGGRPQVTEFGFHRLVERLQAQLFQGWLRGDLKVKFLGVHLRDARPCYGLEFGFPSRRGREYPAAQIVTYWDVQLQVPVVFEEYEANGLILERQSFSQLQLNAALNDMDFHPANPAYGFLLFRQAPRVDRFVTGRD